MASSSSSQIHPSVVIGDMVQLDENIHIEQGVIFAEDVQNKTVIRANVRIGAGAVIGGGVEVGWGAYVMPGAVILSSIPANAIASGNPAQIVGYTTELSRPAHAIAHTPGISGNRKSIEVQPLKVGQSALYLMPQVIDLRGNLTVGEFDESLPFRPQRYFVVFDVPSEKLRGEHAHHICHQFLICLRGSCTALLDDGHTRQEVALNRPDVGLYMPPLIWGTQYRYSHDAVLLVFASHSYDPADYIRTYDEFQAVAAQN